jgi:hypothetical protein
VFAVSCATSACGLDQFEGKSVQVNYVFTKTVVPVLSLNENDLIDEFSCVQKYYERKLEVWNKKMPKMLLKSGVKY